MRWGRGLLLGALMLVTTGCGAARGGPAGGLPAGPGPETGRAAPAATGAAPGQYRIGPEDVLFVSVWREEGLARQIRVRPDGHISFPLVGDVRAAGLTVTQLESEIARLLTAYVAAPVVSVIVEDVNSYKVYVLGQVERPGALPVKSPVTVLQALALAGGLKPFADADRMVLVRERAGRTLRVRLNYADLVLGRNEAVNLTLESGDTIVVP